MLHQRVSYKLCPTVQDLPSYNNPKHTDFQVVYLYITEYSNMKNLLLELNLYTW